MVDLSCSLAGMRSPNPFWLASGPPTDNAFNVLRGFKAGWGGAVWKTIKEDPPVVNVCPRYGAMSIGDQKIVGLSNIELISDRPLSVNLREIREVKREYPDRALVVSAMAPLDESSWVRLIAKVEETGADGIELNLSCPHGMTEQKMGSVIGQVPILVGKVTAWCREHTGLPLLVKLTPNVTDIREPARAAVEAGADGISLINTVNCMVGVYLETLAPIPDVNGLGTHGGYSGPAIKPIALHMVTEVAKNLLGFPISAVGGISSWRDAAEFLALGASNVQVCTAVMHHGFGIVEDLIRGLSHWMEQKTFSSLARLVGISLQNVTEWSKLDLSHKVVSVIHQEKCIRCGLCLTACDSCHQAIHVSEDKRYEVDESCCKGCGLCYHVCPVPGGISLEKPCF